MNRRSFRRAGLLALPLAAILLVSACSDDADGDEDATATAMADGSTAASMVAATTADGQLEIIDPWARATPGNPDESSAAYMQIRSVGTADRLVGAAWEGGLAREVQIHEMVMSDGQMKMQQVEGWDIPAGGTLELAAGGNHVMLLGLSQQLKPGDTVSLTLTFERAGEITIEVPVRDAASSSMDDSAMTPTPAS